MLPVAPSSSRTLTYPRHLPQCCPWHPLHRTPSPTPGTYPNAARGTLITAHPHLPPAPTPMLPVAPSSPHTLTYPRHLPQCCPWHPHHRTPSPTPGTYPNAARGTLITAHPHLPPAPTPMLPVVPSSPHTLTYPRHLPQCCPWYPHHRTPSLTPGTYPNAARGTLITAHPHLPPAPTPMLPVAPSSPHTLTYPRHLPQCCPWYPHHRTPSPTPGTYPNAARGTLITAHPHLPPAPTPMLPVVPSSPHTLTYPRHLPQCCPWYPHHRTPSPTPGTYPNAARGTIFIAHPDLPPAPTPMLPVAQSSSRTLTYPRHLPQCCPWHHFHHTPSPTPFPPPAAPYCSDNIEHNSSDRELLCLEGIFSQRGTTTFIYFSTEYGLVFKIFRHEPERRNIIHSTFAIYKLIGLINWYLHVFPFILRVDSFLWLQKSRKV